MLTKLTLKNWKSYSGGDLYIDPLSVLIGTNASGKSNAIDAFQFLNRIAGGTLLTAALQGDSGLLPLRGGIEWAALRPQFTFALNVTYRADELTDYEYEIECHIFDNRCEVSSEKLIRTKYRSDKHGNRKRDTAHAGKIQLFWTDACTNDSPTITARTYNGSRGTARQLSRAHAVIYQLSSQKLGQEISEGVNPLILALKEIFILDPIPYAVRNLPINKSLMRNYMRIFYG
jgi:hypothetical protein